MTGFDWVLVAVSLVAGALFTWDLHRMLVERRREDAEFSRNLAVGGQLDHKTGLFTGSHPEGVPATDILKREATGVQPIAGRTASSCE